MRSKNLEQSEPRECLIIFARYPELGKVKTRLISAIGAELATSIYTEMAEHTLEQARTLQNRRSHLVIQVWFTGGSKAQMQAWLGRDLSYQEQIEGTLGDRMASAVETAIAQGYESVAIVGTDCPELEVEILDQGFKALQKSELVLGQATDGGYYLIGMQRFIPELFANIPWSSDQVYSKTVDLAEKLDLIRADLPPLSDVDFAPDLEIWEKVKLSKSAVGINPRISIIIPALNEAENLVRLLNSLQNAPVEVIVVDGGSTDRTLEVAKSLGAVAIAGVKGRAAQMNLGASIAKAKILVFLHADTLLPDRFEQMIFHTLQDPDVVAGAFGLEIDGDRFGFRLIEWGVSMRSRLWQMPYGDQAIFLKTETFRLVGGFPLLPIMEDFEFVRRLKRLGSIAIASESVLTSGRRWQKLNIFRTTAINQIIVIGYFLGISPVRLAQWYQQGKTKSPSHKA
jgi:uncharacterized protein